MYNWSVDTTRLEKDSEEYEKFALEQMINFGLNGKKLPLRTLKKHWNVLEIDFKKRNFLNKIVWTQF